MRYELVRYTNAPHYSCPDFDKAIEHIEAARTINETLREHNRSFEQQIDAAQDRIDILEALVKTLEDKLEDVQQALDVADEKRAGLVGREGGY